METDVSRSIDEQLSAFLDGELPDEELQLLVRRLERDGEHRATLARYSLIGNILRKDPVQSAAEGFRSGIAAAIEQESEIAAPVTPERASRSWAMPAATAAVVALAAVGLWGNRITDSGSPGAGASLALTRPQPESAVAEVAPPLAEPVAVDAVPNRARRVVVQRRSSLNRDRLTSYMVSHGERARSFQGPMADSRIFVQQASFEE